MPQFKGLLIEAVTAQVDYFCAFSIQFLHACLLKGHERLARRITRAIVSKHFSERPPSDYPDDNSRTFVTSRSTSDSLVSRHSNISSVYP